MKLLVLMVLIIGATSGEDGFDYEIYGQKFSLPPERIDQTLNKTLENLPFLIGESELIKKTSFLSLLLEPGVQYLEDLQEIFEYPAKDLLRDVNPPNKDDISDEISDIGVKWNEVLRDLKFGVNRYMDLLRSKGKSYKEMTPSEQEEHKKKYSMSVRRSMHGFVTATTSRLINFINGALDPALKIIQDLNPGSSLEGEKVARKIADYYIKSINDVY